MNRHHESTVEYTALFTEATHFPTEQEALLCAHQWAHGKPAEVMVGLGALNTVEIWVSDDFWGYLEVVNHSVH